VLRSTFGSESALPQHISEGSLTTLALLSLHPSHYSPPVFATTHVVAGASIWRGAWPTFVDAATAARVQALPRAELEECLLQAVLFCGFPRVVTAFEQLTAAWPAASPPGGGGVPADERRAAGSALFADSPAT
jgi:hypothetical protein